MPTVLNKIQDVILNLFTKKRKQSIKMTVVDNAFVISTPDDKIMTIRQADESDISIFYWTIYKDGKQIYQFKYLLNPVEWAIYGKFNCSIKALRQSFNKIVSEHVVTYATVEEIVKLSTFYPDNTNFTCKMHAFPTETVFNCSSIKVGEGTSINFHDRTFYAYDKGLYTISNDFDCTPLNYYIQHLQKYSNSNLVILKSYTTDEIIFRFKTHYHEVIEFSYRNNTLSVTQSIYGKLYVSEYNGNKEIVKFFDNFLYMTLKKNPNPIFEQFAEKHSFFVSSMSQDELSVLLMMDY